MKYDFVSILDRKGKDAMALDGLGMVPGMAPDPPKDGFEVIPMWVADMNFPTVPTIPEAIIERAKHPAYGYFSPSEEYFSDAENASLPLTRLHHFHLFKNKRPKRFNSDLRFIIHYFHIWIHAVISCSLF